MRRHHVLALSIAIATLLPAFAAAQQVGIPSQIVPATCDGIHCSCGDLVKLAENILNTGIYLAVFMSAILFAWAGWKMISGRSLGDPHQIEEAKKILWNVIIGLVIILAAWLLVDTLMRTLTTTPIWSNICKMT